MNRISVRSAQLFQSIHLRVKSFNFFEVSYFLSNKNYYLLENYSNGTATYDCVLDPLVCPRVVCHTVHILFLCKEFNR